MSIFSDLQIQFPDFFADNEEFYFYPDYFSGMWQPFSYLFEIIANPS